jgi:large subunit ribosomal protein L10Ae
MSKIPREALTEAIKEILRNSNDKDSKRGFLETIELQISLKNYDPVKDKRFSGAYRLPHTPRPKYAVCIMGDAKHVGDAQKEKIPCLSVDDLKKLDKNKKAIKKLCQQYDAFLASASLIRRIPRIVGPGLNKAGKFPSQLGNNDNVKAKVEDQKATVKFQLKSKKTMCMGVAIANVSMTEAEITANITSAVNYLVSLLTKNWQQIKRLYIKSTMGPAHRIYGF